MESVFHHLSEFVRFLFQWMWLSLLGMLLLLVWYRKTTSPGDSKPEHALNVRTLAPGRSARTVSRNCFADSILGMPATLSSWHGSKTPVFG